MRIAALALITIVSAESAAQGVNAGPVQETVFGFEQLVSDIVGGSAQTRNGLVATTRGSILGGIVMRLTGGRFLLGDYTEGTVAYYAGSGGGLDALPSRRTQFALGLQAGMSIGGETQVVARTGLTSLTEGFSERVQFYTGRVRRGAIAVEGTLYSGETGSAQAATFRWFLPLGPRGLNAQLRYLSSDFDRNGLLTADITSERSVQLAFGIER